jgi:hypothetical protein
MTAVFGEGALPCLGIRHTSLLEMTAQIARDYGLLSDSRSREHGLTGLDD